MKIFLKVATAIVAVVLAAALVAPVVFSGKIAEIVKTEANGMLRARVDFEKLNISLLRHFPNASLEIKGLTLIGAEPFEGDTIAAVERISVVVDPWSLFGDSGFEVSKVFIARPALHAHKLSSGSVNWDVMRPSAEEDNGKADASDPSSFKLSVRDFRITDASIRYLDDSTHLQFHTSPASLRLRGDMSAARCDIDLKVNAREIHLLTGPVTLLSGAEAEMNAVIDADLERNRFTFSHNTLRLNAIRVKLDGWAELSENAVTMDMKAGCDKVEFKDVLSMIPAFYTRNFRGLAASGELSLGVWARGEMRGATLPAFGMDLAVNEGSFQYSSLPQAVTNINIAAKVSNPGGVMDKTVVDLSKFGLKMAGNTLSATLYATNLVSDPDFRATASGHIDLGAVKKVYPLEKGTELAGQISADLKVSGRMSDIEKQRYDRIGASGSFVVEGMNAHVGELPEIHIRRAAATITPSAMTLGDFGLTIGRSDLAANGQLTDYMGYLLRGSTLSGRLYVKSDLLDLNEILDAVPASDTAVSDAPAAAEPARVIEVPENLRLSLITELHKVLFGKMTLNDITGEMALANGVLSLDKLRLNAFGGAVSASGSYSTAADARHPAVKMSLGITHASFSKTFDELDMIKQLVPLFEKTGGDYSMKLDLQTSLDEHMSADLMSVNASGELKSANIHVQNIGAFDALAKALGNDALRNVEAKDVAVRFTVRDGRLATQPFDLKIGNVNLNLSGSTGLDQRIDYTAKVSLPDGLTGGVLTKINVGIGGTFSAPKITLGVKEAAEEAIKNVVDEQLEKLTGGKSLGEEVAKQAAQLREEARKAGDKLVEAAKDQRAKLIEAAKNPIAKIAAEKAGDKLVSEAEKQAGRLTAEADKQVQKLTAKQE